MACSAPEAPSASPATDLIAVTGGAVPTADAIAAASRRSSTGLPLADAETAPIVAGRRPRRRARARSSARAPGRRRRAAGQHVGIVAARARRATRPRTRAPRAAATSSASSTRNAAPSPSTAPVRRASNGHGAAPARRRLGGASRPARSKPRNDSKQSSSAPPATSTSARPLRTSCGRVAERLHARRRPGRHRGVDAAQALPDRHLPGGRVQHRVREVHRARVLRAGLLRAPVELADRAHAAEHRAERRGRPRASLRSSSDQPLSASASSTPTSASRPVRSSGRMLPGAHVLLGREPRDSRRRGGPGTASEGKTVGGANARPALAQRVEHGCRADRRGAQITPIPVTTTFLGRSRLALPEDHRRVVAAERVRVVHGDVDAAAAARDWARSRDRTRDRASRS